MGTERTNFTLREGAYFGNLFATTPVTYDETTGAFVPAWTTEKEAGATGTGISIGTYDQNNQFVPGIPQLPDGPVKLYLTTPVLTACAGPDSNVPAITEPASADCNTNRFGS